MKVKIVQRKNPQKPDEPGKFYGQPVLDGVVGMDMICRQIAGRSSLTAGDVKNVLTNFLDELPTYMLMNRSVQLEDFGILRISFGSEGVDRAEDFSCQTPNLQPTAPPFLRIPSISPLSKFRLVVWRNTCAAARPALQGTGRPCRNTGSPLRVATCRSFDASKQHGILRHEAVCLIVVTVLSAFFP